MFKFSIMLLTANTRVVIDVIFSPTVQAIPSVFFIDSQNSTAVSTIIKKAGDSKISKVWYRQVRKRSGDHSTGWTPDPNEAGRESKPLSSFDHFSFFFFFVFATNLAQLALAKRYAHHKVIIMHDIILLCVHVCMYICKLA